MLLNRIDAIKNLITAAVIICIAAGLSGCRGEDDNTLVLRLAHSLTTDHSVHKAMEFMGQRLRDISDGAMEIAIYPSGQLGSERELVELLQIGSLAMTKVSASPMEGFVSIFKVFSIPYVFRDSQHFWQTLEGPIGQQLLQAAEPVRLRGLGFYDAGIAWTHSGCQFFPLVDPQHSDRYLYRRRHATGDVVFH